MKFNYKPGKENYFDYLKKLMWVKKRKSSKKEKEENKVKENITITTLEELNR